jgi:hypothetical protein
MEIQLKGQDKDLLVEGSKIRIHQRKGLLQPETEKTIQISKISSVQIKKPGLVVGYIQFSISGGVEKNQGISMTGGALAAATDENAVLFMGKENYDIALKIKEYVEDFEHDKETSTASSSPADEIRKYKSLADDGIISIEEFEKKKKQLLGL